MTIPVSYSAEEKFDSQADSIGLGVDTTLASLGWDHDQTVPGSFKGHIGMSIWSWGENFTITITPDGAVRMKSVCRFPFTIVSWGKNKRNVNRFFAGLKKVLIVTA
jgi:hypothetical protein